ncbi:MAG TPA: hypothetical protein VER33_11505 [Polyangiaceae bacterium]|nr:hypothetical protein [Polyangiaceae bacterium]
MPLPLIDFILCPRCAGPLAPQDKGAFRCRSCDQRFPAVDKLPCLLPDLRPWKQRWQGQLAFVEKQAELTVDALQEEGRKPGLLPTTQERLRQQIAAQATLVREVQALLLPAVGQRAPGAAAELELRPLESLHLLFRDWGWPESDENARALQCVEQVLSAPLGRVLVIGAGACRLAYDLHVQHGADTTLALDVDPLLLGVAQKLLAGARVELTESRIDAVGLHEARASRELKAPQGAAAGMHLLLADGLAPPLRARSFDTVVTPWFIDQVPPDLRELIGVLHGLLVPEGRWLNFGPLIYPAGHAGGCRFSADELFELQRRAGFTLDKTVTVPLPYSVSPLTRRGKQEHCLAFSARATEPPSDEPGELPSWIVLPYLPVPDFAGRVDFEHESATLRAVVSLIDGRRSVRDIGAALAASAGLDPPGMNDTVRYCLLQTHPACRGFS